MTTTTKAHRQRRYRMAVAYLNRRAHWRAHYMPGHVYMAYREWVDAFPAFMVIAYPGAIRRAAEHGRRGEDREAVQEAERQARARFQARRKGLPVPSPRAVADVAQQPRVPVVGGRL